MGGRGGRRTLSLCFVSAHFLAWFRVIILLDSFQDVSPANTAFIIAPHV